MDTVFPLKSKKTIKAINQAISHNNAMMRLKMQNALYQQELNKAKAALELAQQQQQRDSLVAAASAQRQQHEAIIAAASAQRQQHEAIIAAALAQHHQAALVANKKADEVVPSNANKQEPVTTLHNKKSSNFSKLLSNMNKHH
jgi:hypothetical protein